MRSFIALSLLSFFYTPLLFAGSDHSIEFSVSEYDEYMLGLNRSAKIKPQIHTVNYGYSIEDEWQLSLSYWQGEGEIDWSERIYIKRELDGGRVSISYQPSALWFELGSGLNESDTNLNDLLSRVYVQEKIRSAEFFFGSGYESDISDFLLSVSLSYSYQETDSVLLEGRASGSEQGLEQDEDGTYLSAGLQAAYPYVINDSTFILPYIGLSWTEVLSGEVRLQSTLRGGGGNIRLGEERRETNDFDGNGFGVLGVTLFYDEFSGDLSWAEVIDEPLAGSQLSLGFGVSF